MTVLPANVPLPATPGVGTMQFNGGLPFFPPNNIPLPSPLLARPGLHSRRSHSVSLGGPPKAVLGGPKRQDTSTTGAVGADAPAVSASGANSGLAGDFTKLKMKKCAVKLPVESKLLQNGMADTSPPLWTREPLRLSTSSMQEPMGILEVSTADAHPDLMCDTKHALVLQIDVFLPRKV